MARAKQHGNSGDRHLNGRQLVYLDHSPKKVWLQCMGPSCTDYLGPTLTQEYNPTEFGEIWAINMAANAFRCDVVFWMDDLIEQEKFKPNLFVALRKFGMPVITSIRRPNVVPNSFDYPIVEIGNIGIPIFGKPYLNNGVAMAIAYALWKGVKKLTICGADFSYPNRDYAESGRACVEAWVTVAAMKDMEITITPSSSLLDAVKDNGIYGYNEQPDIPMPGGRVFKYVKRSEIGKYVPEDSSGVKNASVPAPVSGNSREPAPAQHGMRRQQLVHLAAAYDLPIDRDATKDQILRQMVTAEEQGVFRKRPLYQSQYLMAMRDPDRKLSFVEQSEFDEALLAAEKRERLDGKFIPAGKKNSPYYQYQEALRQRGIDPKGMDIHAMKSRIEQDDAIREGKEVPAPELGGA
jgi:hypothetical protein